MSEGPDPTSSLPSVPPAPLSYRAPTDDRPTHDLGRAWVLTRAWFYVIFFSLMLTVFAVGTIAILRESNDVPDRGDVAPLAGIGCSILLMALMTWRSIRSLRLLARRRISHPFEEPATTTVDEQTCESPDPLPRNF